MSKDYLQFQDMDAINYMSFRELKFNFQTGLYIVLGENHDSAKSSSNGSGKSSIVELLGWVAYGQFEREDPSTDAKGDLEGNVTFFKGDHKYRIQRFYHDKKMGNGVFIYLDGEDITPKRVADRQPEIDKVLGMSYQLFTQTVAILQNLLSNFTLLTPTVRKSMLEDMIGSSFYDEYKKKFNLKYKALMLDKGVADKDFEDNRVAMIGLSATITTSKELMDTVIKAITAEITEITANLRADKDKLNNLTAKPVTKDSLNIVEEKLKHTREEIRDLQKTITDNKKAVEEKKCDRCGHELSEQTKIEFTQQAEVAESVIVTRRVTEAAQLKKRDELLKEFTDYDNEAYKLQTSVSNLATQLAGAKRRLEASNVQVDIPALEKQLDEHRIALEFAVSQQQELNAQIAEIQYLEKLMLPSSPFRSYIIKKYLGFINSIIHEITPGIMDSVVITLDMDSKEGIEIVMTKTDGSWMSYKNLSGGEKKRVDAIMALTFQRFITDVSGTGTNILFLDEFTENVDVPGVENIIASIQAMFSDSCVYVITHSDWTKALFDKSIVVHKTDGVSTIEYE